MFFRKIRTAIANLNPGEVREMAARPLDIGIVAPDDQAYRTIEGYLCPPAMGPSRHLESSRRLHRTAWNQPKGARFDIEIWDASLAAPPHAYVFRPGDGPRMVKDVLQKRPDLAVPLARSFPPFRTPAIEQIIATVAKENALFSVATAVPDVVPFLALPWAIGEFASDTAFLTMNQVRMAFLIAAASGCPVGYSEQKKQIASVVAGAFGFRAIARELVGKIPFGGGLIPKAAIAYAGTQVVGRSIERVLRTGAGFTVEERRSALDQAYETGREAVGRLLEGLGVPRVAR